jgi:tetratricopeptide (TPR) repeat protein
MSRKFVKPLIIGIPALILLGVAVSFFPPVRTRLDIWAAEIRYKLNPPEEVVFVPQEQKDTIELSVTQTLQVLLAPTNTSTLAPTGTPTATQPGPTLPPTETHTPTLTPTPLPATVRLTGFKYQHQHGLWNYCGPSTLATDLSYWGWTVDRQEVGAYLRGSKARFDDKNVMPYEMQNYVETQAGLRMIIRTGGNLELLKALIAAGFPPIVEKDDILDGVGWLGHYLLLAGYDDNAEQFFSMDTYHGEGMRYDYEEMETSWRAFNYTFLVSYPPDREADLLAVLGDFADETWAINHALEIANAEIQTLDGLGEFYAWFNRGSNLNALQDYASAATSFDAAFNLYANLPASTRPWRMMWYQTGPYWAYYYTGRYQDVITLADQTLDNIKDPILEETFYWRGLAKEAIGDLAGAVEDLQTSIELNPNFGPGFTELQRIQGGG